MSSVENSSLKVDNTPPYINQIREWIEACGELHGNKCVTEPISQRLPRDVPVWLVDTHQQCIVSGSSADRYLVLSYVWPETRGSSDSTSIAPHSLLLDNKTLAEFRIPGFLSNEEVVQRMPMVIRYAMLFTSLLGERYLWIDRLCIVQDDFADGGTQNQVAKMDKIYGGAYLAIIAAASEVAYEKGLARIWPSSTWEQPRDRLKAQEVKSDSILYAMKAMYSSLTESRWATRGWTYQEQILCKRAVVFTDEMMFWDCQCSIWNERTLLPGQNFTDIQLRADMGQRFSTRWWPDFSFYLDLVGPYNGRNFSYPQDATLGISGILSALEPAFPGGFIHGLPRVFLDHALLWQPFETAIRRADRSDDDAICSSLPSWSWCGWQSYVDPWSMLSGLSYILDKDCQRRAGSWSTRNLVKWHVTTEDRESEPVLEPQILEQFVDDSRVMDVRYPDGWAIRDVTHSPTISKFYNKGSAFTHEKDSSIYFKHPVPLKESPSQQNLISTPAYLSCSTGTATLYPATVLRRQSTSTSGWYAAEKISVFEHKIFKSGPADDRACPVLVLQQSNGSFAGLLRLMGQEPHIKPSTPIELIAVSTGSAMALDLLESYEWKVFESGKFTYDPGSSFEKNFHFSPDWVSENGRSALLFDFAMAFDRDNAGNGPVRWDLAASFAEIDASSDALTAKAVEQNPEIATDESAKLKAWFKALNKSHWIVTVSSSSTAYRWFPINRTAWGTRVESLIAQHAPLKLRYMVCEFYNVLWIERRDGVAYRRACGWVPKWVWEAHATETVDVTLG